MHIKSYHINSLSELDRLLNKHTINPANGENVDIYVNLDEYSTAVLDKLNELAMKMCLLNSEPHFHFNIEYFNLKEKDYELISDFYVEMKKIDVESDFYDWSGTYPIEQGVDAFFNAEKFIDAVKALNLSPLETHYLICGHLSTYQYKENEQNRDKARTLISVLTGTDIVCLGYAELAQYLHERLGITSITQIIRFFNEEGESDGLHANNVVFIDDKKYGVYDWGYCDITMDANEPYEEPFLRYTHTFLPLCDKDQLQKCKLQVENRALNALYNREERECLVDDMIVDLETCRDAFYQLNLSGEFEKITKETEGFLFIDGAKKASKRLREKLKEKNIPIDVYLGANGMPMESSLPFMIAEYMDEKKNSKMIKLSEKGLNIYMEKKAEFDKTAEMYNITQFSTDDWSKILKGVEEGKYCDLNEDIKNAYICIKSSNFLNGYLKRGKHKPITIETFREILTNIYRSQKTDEKFIKYQVDKVVDFNVERVEHLFSENAQNCFTKEMLKRRTLNEREG